VVIELEAVLVVASEQIEPGLVLGEELFADDVRTAGPENHRRAVIDVPDAVRRQPATDADREVLGDVVLEVRALDHDAAHWTGRFAFV